jgi:hypothetical protein
MKSWLVLLTVSGCVGFVLASLRAVTLGRVTQQYSARSLGLSNDPRVSEVIAAFKQKSRPRRSWSAFRDNLSDPGFWQILIGLWVLITTLSFLSCTLVIWLFSVS